MTEARTFHWPWPDTSAEALLRKAQTAAERAYAPYSKFKVGAALLTADGSIFLGCNVENASYGLTICAERNALTTMVAMAHLDPVAIAIVGGISKTPCPPCGACRQFMTEFNPDMLVVLESPNRMIVISANELLPLSFALSEKR